MRRLRWALVVVMIPALAVAAVTMTDTPFTVKGANPRVVVDGTVSSGFNLNVNGINVATIRGIPTGVEIQPLGAPSAVLRIEATKITALVPIVNAAGVPISGGAMGLACTADPAVVGGFICPAVTVPWLHVTGDAIVDGNVAAKYQ
jgi:hypothetical protein